MGQGSGVREQGRRGITWSADKRVRTIFIVALVVLASGITAASAVDRQERGVVFTVQTDKEEYAVGEEIHMQAEYMNYGFDSVDMTFGSSLVAHFTVHDSDGSLVYSIPQTALWWIVYETLEPGESLRGGCSWNQTDDMCEQVLSPGSYMVFALGGGWEFDFSASTQISITA
jgi:hypothetical protein